MSWECKKSDNKLHQFLYNGANCSFCGISQYDLNKREKPIAKSLGKSYNKPEVNAKSKRGVLFQDLVKFFGITNKQKFFYQTIRYSNDEIDYAMSVIKDRLNRGELKGNPTGYFLGILKNLK